jgi:S-adenosylmethionine-diacylglycerol 3-amino-3-carboxypropyl transferase
MGNEIERRARFDFIRYANCWEDADILCDALMPAPGRRMMSIASGGDNSFALLAEGSEVVAADLSTAQLACVELKVAAIRVMSREEYLAFLGVTPGGNAGKIYRQLKTALSSSSREFWDNNTTVLDAGLVHGGKFERYFQTFRTRIIPLIHSRKTVADLFEQRTQAQRERFFDTRWNNLRWRALFQIFFSRWAMARLGRDPEFFRYVEGSVADRILTRARHALTVLPTHDNPWLDYILNGNFAMALPRYMRPGKYEAVKAGLDRLTWQQGPIQDVAEKDGRGFDGFNLSDIFEYMDPGLFKTIYGQLLASSRQGARLAYWNMLVPRSCPPDFRERVSYHEDLSKKLFQQDKAFFYSAFVVDEFNGDA